MKTDWIKEVIKERWDRNAQRYDNLPGHGFLIEEEEKEWKDFLPRIIGTEKLNVLDVGCGTGVISLLLSGMGHTVTGVDISEGMLQIAKDRANSLNLIIDFRIGDAENLSFEDEFFDMVINRHLLWTLSDPKKAICEWGRVLKPVGRVMIFDGDWDNCMWSHGKIWHYLISMPLILITERRNPWQWAYRKNIENFLPMGKKKHPEADIKILKNCGFCADVMDVQIPRAPRTQTVLKYLKYGNRSNRENFLVRGIKQDGDCETE